MTHYWKPLLFLYVVGSLFVMYGQHQWKLRICTDIGRFEANGRVQTIAAADSDAVTLWANVARGCKLAD